MKLAMLLITVLLLSTIACAASCAGIASESSCHHDQKSPTACAHELVLDRVHVHCTPLEPLPDDRGSIAFSTEAASFDSISLPSDDFARPSSLAPLRI